MKPFSITIAMSGLLLLASCSNNEKNDALKAKQYTIDSMHNELTKRHIIDSMNEVARMQYVFQQPDTMQVAPADAAPVSPRPAARTHSTRRSNTSHSNSSSNSETAGNSSTSGTAAPAPAARKKGWSAKAKGAVIGAGTGAAAGAIINKRNRAAGAVIGGAIGAGVGLGTGAVIDKKNGR